VDAPMKMPSTRGRRTKKLVRVLPILPRLYSRFNNFAIAKQTFCRQTFCQ
jgi:hypothetical protein